MASSDYIEKLRTGFLNASVEYEKAYFDLINFLKLKEFPPEVMISHPYTFQTYTTACEKVLQMNKVFEEMKQKHQALMYCFPRDSERG